ncbi:MAG: FAD:protein FMN transferase [Alphaproteobacteria bacterium]|nr:FAD:protein FMN transferase [Alphaproteobacteria bacterium]
MKANTPVTRRRALTVLAAAAGLPLFGVPRAGARMPELEWRGGALGGPARIVIRDPDEQRVRRILGHCVREVERLEAIFSLYRPHSELTRLNAEGRLAAPSHDLRLVMAEARRFGALSEGAFDVTVQPLWRLHSRHFARHPADREGPAERSIARAAGLVDYRDIDCDDGRIALARRGMAVTLNGIAQGYITDRISDLLRDAGMTGVLVDLGEIRALDAPGGEPWRIGIEDPRDRSRMIGSLSLRGAALATSGGYGMPFDPDGRFHHLFDPATGRSAGQCLSASAVAPDAMTADALATALVVAGTGQARSLLAAFGGSHARLTLHDGTVVEDTL